jgi:hypothetical protein
VYCSSSENGTWSNKNTDLTIFVKFGLGTIKIESTTFLKVFGLLISRVKHKRLMALFAIRIGRSSAVLF